MKGGCIEACFSNESTGLITWPCRGWDTSEFASNRSDYYTY